MTPPPYASSSEKSLGQSDDSDAFDILATTKKSTGKNKTIEERYQKKSQLEHILLRPDTYVGSLEPETTTTWTWSDEDERMVYKTLTIIPAMFKIFDEILVNAADVKAREMHERRTGKMQKMTKVEVDIDEENATISVLNDGDGIPVEIHKEHQVYVPELIFGHLLTSDNYDDSDQRVTGGRNGFGAKLTNIFSERFEAEVVDSTRKRKFFMKWSENMSKHTEPKVVECRAKSDYVRITFRPDLERFKTRGLGPDLVSLMKKRVYDISGTTGVRVSLNGNQLAIRDFKSYVNLYYAKAKRERESQICDTIASAHSPISGQLKYEEASSDTGSDFEASKKALFRKREKQERDPDEENPVVKIHEKVNDRWEIVVSQSEGQFQQVSFVNSICTTKGGTHVNYVVEPLLAAILKKVTAKNKGGMIIKQHHVRQHLFVFVNCLVVNPTFDSQTKETLTLKASQFGSTCTVSDKTISAVVKSPITETVLLWAQTKEQVDLKRRMKVAGGTKGRDRILGIPKLEDANEAGGRRALDCTLILTEGDSAKTSCLAGLSVVGRDAYGVFPLRGKMLNVRDAGFKQLTENKELQNILTITGLEVGKKYTDLRGLRYGSVMIMTDQDHDGSHIKGLLISFLEHYWPDLLKIPGFLKEFVTPIVKVFRKKDEEIAFFTIPEYEQWKVLNNGGKGWRIKYYKGLGTSRDTEFKEYFSALEKHQLQFDYEADSDFEAIDMAFNPKRAEDRKQWIQSFQDGTFLDHDAKAIRYKDFVNKELVLFSKYDTERSIPSLMDGWKPGQRKVLFAVIRKGLTKSEMKVAQLAAYTAEQSCYHHGEESLCGTIVNMAQTFCGSNNLNVLEPCGQFGSRKEGGKDASAARYIYTKLSVTARALFVPSDDELLTYNKEEGRVIEPRWYVPCIPVVLVNGAEGIGTGWSCSIPNYNPKDIIANLRRFIRGEAMEEITPWYRGFIGRIEKQSNGRGFESVGLIKKIDDETLEISELPVKFWTQNYKEFLEDWLLKSAGDTGNDMHQVVGRGRARGAVAKAKAKTSAGRGRGTGSRNVLSEKVYKYPIQDYRDNSTHQHIKFVVKMDPAHLALAESEGLEKVFRLRKTIPTTNMTLFDAEGLVTRYENVLDIMREFAKVRLQYYHKRRRHTLNLLQKDLCLVSNKMRFVLEVIEEKLVVHKQKRLELIAELRRRGFDTYLEILERFKTVNPTLEGEIGEDGVVNDPEESQNDVVRESGLQDYDYLLGMPLWNLTHEKVEELKRQQQSKEVELELFRKKTPEFLWEEDLDHLESAINQQDKELEECADRDQKFSHSTSLKGPFGKTGRSAASRAKAAPRPKKENKKENVKPVAPPVTAIDITMATEATAHDKADIKTDTMRTLEKDFSLMERLRRKINRELEGHDVVQLDSSNKILQTVTESQALDLKACASTNVSTSESTVPTVESVKHSSITDKIDKKPVPSARLATKRPLSTKAQMNKKIKKPKILASDSSDVDMESNAIPIVEQRTGAEQGSCTSRDSEEESDSANETGSLSDSIDFVSDSQSSGDVSELDSSEGVSESE